MAEIVAKKWSNFVAEKPTTDTMKSRFFVFPFCLFLLTLACCHGGNDSATMRELAGIDSLLTVARDYQNAQNSLDSLQPDGFNQAERAYYSLLLTQ